jgi:hypothetical protein
MARSRKIRRRVGDVVQIPLDHELFGYGRVLHEPLMAFYTLINRAPSSLDEMILSPVAFKIFVMNHAITGGKWRVIGNRPLESDLLVEPIFFKRDRITGRLALYRDSTGEETPATKEECSCLECAAVWEPEHVEDRLRDLNAGRMNKWVESLRA